MQNKTIEYFDGDVRLEGYLAFDEKQTTPRPGILVVHDWTGLNDHAKERADRLAEMGYVGLAVDMYGEAKTGNDNEEKLSLIKPLLEDRNLVLSRMQAALDALKQQTQVDANNLAAMGFCFGGMSSLDSARAGQDIKAAISFHGDLSKPNFETVSPIEAKILALHGHADPHIPPEAVVAFEAEMTEANANWEFVSYSNAMHAFTNKLANDYDFGTVYNEQADRRSWVACGNFLSEVFA